jgi:hypothetical protein
MPTSTNTNPQSTASRMGAMQSIVHLPRTLKIAGHVLKDERVNIMPKIMFVGGIVALLAALLTPEAFAELVNLIPGLGQLLGVLEIPVDGAVDWIALAFAALNLMRLFPQDVVNEHYNNVTQNSKPTGPIVDADPKP